MKVILGIAAALAIALLALSAYAVHTMRRAFDASTARSRAALAAHRQQFMDDQKALAAHPLFASRPGKRDAGPLIGPRVRWLRATSAAASSPSVPDKMPDAGAVEAVGDSWLSAGPEAWTGLDFGWMAQLRDYDLWDVDQNSVPADPRFFSDPEPDTRDLWTWAKLRLAKGAHDRALEPAIGEVQELARLAFTTERFATQIAALPLLEFVRQASERLGTTTHGISVDAETSRRIRRVIFGALAFARLETPASYEKDFSEIAVGRCAALHDGVRTALLLRQQLRDTHPAEFQHLERLLDAAPDCRLSWLRKRWALPDDEGLTRADNWKDRMVRLIPGARRFSGEILAAVSQQEWFKAYEEAPRSGEPEHQPPGSSQGAR